MRVAVPSGEVTVERHTPASFLSTGGAFGSGANNFSATGGAFGAGSFFSFFFCTRANIPAASATRHSTPRTGTKRDFTGRTPVVSDATAAEGEVALVPTARAVVAADKPAAAEQDDSSG